MKKVLCLTCGKRTPYHYDMQRCEVEYRGVSLVVQEMVAYCNICGDRVDVPGLWDYNLEEIQKKYLDFKKYGSYRPDKEIEPIKK